MRSPSKRSSARAQLLASEERAALVPIGGAHDLGRDGARSTSAIRRAPGGDEDAVSIGFAGAFPLRRGQKSNWRRHSSSDYWSAENESVHPCASRRPSGCETRSDIDGISASRFDALSVAS